jgi:hypothetical protein
LSKWPNKAVSTKPSMGIDMPLNIIGHAIAQTLAVLTSLLGLLSILLEIIINCEREGLVLRIFKRVRKLV